MTLRNADPQRDVSSFLKSPEIQAAQKKFVQAISDAVSRETGKGVNHALIYDALQDPLETVVYKLRDSRAASTNLSIARKLLQAAAVLAKPMNTKLVQAEDDLAYFLSFDIHGKKNLPNREVDEFIKTELAAAIEKIRSKAKKLLKK